MKKSYIITFMALLLFSSIALADVMGWGRGGMMGLWPFGLGTMTVFGVFLGIVWVLALIFWIWMLVDAIKRRFDDNVEKLIWILVIIFVHIIGALIYYFIIKARNRSSAVIHKRVSPPRKSRVTR